MHERLGESPASSDELQSAIGFVALKIAGTGDTYRDRQSEEADQYGVYYRFDIPKDTLSKSTYFNSWDKCHVEFFSGAKNKLTDTPQVDSAISIFLSCDFVVPEEGMVRQSKSIIIESDSTGFSDSDAWGKVIKPNEVKNSSPYLADKIDEVRQLFELWDAEEAEAQNVLADMGVEALTTISSVEVAEIGLLINSSI